MLLWSRMNRWTLKNKNKKLFLIDEMAGLIVSQTLHSQNRVYFPYITNGNVSNDRFLIDISCTQHLPAETVSSLLLF